MHNLVKSFLTSIKFTLGSLSRKIKNPCLVINKKFFNKGDTLMYQNKISLLLILAFLLSILISCGGDPSTNIKSKKVYSTYYTGNNRYVENIYNRNDIIDTNDYYSITFKLPENEAFNYIYECENSRILVYYDGIVKPSKDDFLKTMQRGFESFRIGVKSYGSRLNGYIDEENSRLVIERTDIKTGKLNNEIKYFLTISLHGVYPENDYRTVPVYNLVKYETDAVYGGYSSKWVSNDVYTIEKETLEVAFTVLMKDKSGKIKPIHVENYMFYEDRGKPIYTFNYDISDAMRFQVRKFIDEIDLGYRGEDPKQTKTTKE